METSRGIVLGLVGPVCAGKSQVAGRLRELGAEVYEADAVVRSLYERPDVMAEVRQLLGSGVFQADGAVDRSAIAARVFGSAGDAELRRRLTQEIIFPRTGELLRAKLDQFRATAGPTDLLVLDAPTLFEAGRADWCDRIVLVTAPPVRRQEWSAARGWSAGELDRRDRAMWPEVQKRSRADFVIENNAGLAELRGEVDRMWRRLQGGAAEKKH